MPIKTYNPTTPSLRFTSTTDKSELWNGAPHKPLTAAIKKNGGRNNAGRITCRHKGGGHKRSFRVIDFKRNKLDVPATVERIEYDPNRSAHIALVKYQDGDFSYIIAPAKLKAGDTVVSSSTAEISVGNCLPLSNIPTGTSVHNVEFQPAGGAKIIRSAGCFAQLLSKTNGYAILKLRSGEVRKVPLGCRAVIGVVSNGDNQNQKLGKAGRNRWLGVRPTVRGVAMNPVDHPHGGGEGKTSGGRHPVSPWGWKTKGKRTRNNKRTNSFIVRKPK